MKKVILGLSLSVVLAACGSNSSQEGSFSQLNAPGEEPVKVYDDGTVVTTVYNDRSNPLAGYTRTTVIPNGDPACLEWRRRTGIEGGCDLKNVLRMGRDRLATAEEIAAAGDLVSANGVRLADAARTGAVHIVDWDQLNELSYYKPVITVDVQHKGEVFWTEYEYDENGNQTRRGDAWISKHRCGNNSYMLVSISTTFCSDPDSRVHDSYESDASLHYVDRSGIRDEVRAKAEHDFTVSMLFEGSPIVFAGTQTYTFTVGEYNVTTPSQCLQFIDPEVNCY